MRCLTSARFNMTADILRQGVDAATPTPDPDNTEYGSWQYQQDPLTHQIVREWVPSPIVADDPSTPTVDEARVLTVPCIARGIIDGGIRVAGTTERFGEQYQGVDFVRITFPANVVITSRDRITNIRGANGEILWLDEEVDPMDSANWRATVFDVLGVSPVPDPFGQLIEQTALLTKSEVYSA